MGKLIRSPAFDQGVDDGEVILLADGHLFGGLDTARDDEERKGVCSRGGFFGHGVVLLVFLWIL